MNDIKNGGRIWKRCLLCVCRTTLFVGSERRKRKAKEGKIECQGLDG